MSANAGSRLRADAEGAAGRNEHHRQASARSGDLVAPSGSPSSRYRLQHRHQLCGSVFLSLRLSPHHEIAAAEFHAGRGLDRHSGTRRVLLQLLPKASTPRPAGPCQRAAHDHPSNRAAGSCRHRRSRSRPSSLQKVVRVLPAATVGNRRHLHRSRRQQTVHRDSPHVHLQRHRENRRHWRVRRLVGHRRCRRHVAGQQEPEGNDGDPEDLPHPHRHGVRAGSGVPMSVPLRRVRRHLRRLHRPRDRSRHQTLSGRRGAGDERGSFHR